MTRPPRPTAQNIIDVIHQFYGDSLGYSAPEARTDYSNFTAAFNTTNYEGVYIPSGWSGTYPGAGTINSADNTFLSIRPWYTSVADYPLVQNYLNGGSAPVFNYHRFWAEGDIATAFDAFAYLFPNVSPPASATPTVTVTNPGSQTSSVGTAASLQVKASDSATGKTLAYSATDLPLGLSISSSTGAVTGKPTIAGSYTTTVTVNDGSFGVLGQFHVDGRHGRQQREHRQGHQSGQSDRCGRHPGQPADPGVRLGDRQDPDLQCDGPALGPVDQFGHRPDLRYPDRGGCVHRLGDRLRRHRSERHGELHLDDRFRLVRLRRQEAVMSPTRRASGKVGSTPM